MAYVAVKGGKEAIEASIEGLAYERLKSGNIPDAAVIESSMRVLIDQIMSESSLYSESIAALAIKQAEGSPEEAVFLMRAFRSTLPRKHYCRESSTENMLIERRISAAFKDIPGGQVLGTSTDYTHRLLDFTLFHEDPDSVRSWVQSYLDKDITPAEIIRFPKVIDYLRSEGLIKTTQSSESEPSDVTKKSIAFPAERSERLQILTRGQTGSVTSLGYAALRAYGALHPTVGELRVGLLPICIDDPYNESSASDEDSYFIGEVRITEVESLIPVSIPLGQGKTRIEFEIGYGICFGQNETKAIAMSILDQCLETGDQRYPTHNEEFVLLHIDSVEASGFISHLKLPHYVTFQSKLDSVRQISRKQQKRSLHQDKETGNEDEL